MKIRRFIIFLVLALLTIGVVSDSEAQFWKKKSKRHKHKHTEATGSSDSTQVASAKADDAAVTKMTKAQRKKEKKERKKREKEAKKELKKSKKKHKGKTPTEVATTASPAPPAANAQPTIIKKWIDIEYPPSQRKTHYRIDILAPMYLDELVKNGYPVKNIPAKALQGLDFYKGVQIAADTLKKAQFDIDIYVHDIASTDESTENLVNKNIMDSTDLVIGAVTAKDVHLLADYAKTKQINFISALSQFDGGVTDNPYFTLLLPTLKSHCEWITEDIQNRHTKGKTLLLCRSSNTADDSVYRYLTANAGKKLFAPLVCNNFPTKAALAKWIDTTNNNIIVIAVQDIKYADSLLKGLKQFFPYTHFEAFGMPGWLNMPNSSKPGIYPNIQIDITTPFSFHEQAATYKYVSGVFKTEYGGKPGEQVYIGYETMFWYANMLKRYGTIFNKQYNDNETAPFTKFAIKPQWDDKTGNVIYFENRHLYLEQYVNGVVSERE